MNGTLLAAEWAWRAGALVFWFALAVTVVEVVGHIVRPLPRKPHHHQRRAS